MLTENRINISINDSDNILLFVFKLTKKKKERVRRSRTLIKPVQCMGNLEDISSKYHHC